MFAGDLSEGGKPSEWNVYKQRQAPRLCPPIYDTLKHPNRRISYGKTKSIGPPSSLCAMYVWIAATVFVGVYKREDRRRSIQELYVLFQIQEDPEA